MKRISLADHIVRRLSRDREIITEQYRNSAPDIGYFYVDDVLPSELAREIARSFPNPETMMLKKSLREHKYVAAQMNNYNPILEEAIYAFQDSNVVGLIKDITGIESLYPDDKLYAGGISM